MFSYCHSEERSDEESTISPRRGRDTERESSQCNSRRLNSYPSLPRLDKQERMYHTRHRRLPTAKPSQNGEMEQNGTKWNKNKENFRMDKYSPLLIRRPCNHSPGPPNFTITSEMPQNATRCNKFTNNSRASPSGVLPFPRLDHPGCGLATRNCTA